MRIITATGDRAILESFLARSRIKDCVVEARVREIVSDIQTRGDQAVREWTERVENRALGAFEVEIASQVDPQLRASLELAAHRIRTFHERERASYESWEIDEAGIRLGLRFAPLHRVGVYVPGGKARYPSTVLMAAIPAQVAGVAEICVATPNPAPEVLVAAALAGVTRVFALGGAQAIAAMAYGTETVPRVDKIVGPGNMWVTAAKRLVSGDAGIDALAGPTELVILADDSANPKLVAADLLAQAEHDEAARPLLITTSEDLARKVIAETETQLLSLARRAIAEVSLRASFAIIVESSAEALALCNHIAPEHVEIHMRSPNTIAVQIHTAGAIFVGPMTPEPCGDYLAGPSHVLPTGGTARFGSPLGVIDFLKRTSIIEYSPHALHAQSDDILRLAEAEGLVGHAQAVRARLNKE